MYIYKIERRFEEGYYLAHETKFSQEEFNLMCEAAEKDILPNYNRDTTSFDRNKRRLRYNAFTICEHLVENHGFIELDTLCVCEFDKDEEEIIEEVNIRGEE